MASRDRSACGSGSRSKTGFKSDDRAAGFASAVAQRGREIDEAVGALRHVADRELLQRLDRFDSRLDRAVDVADAERYAAIDNAERFVHDPVAPSGT
jgi:hypothetical protein